MFTPAARPGTIRTRESGSTIDVNAELLELDYLEADIRNKVNRTHLNVRVVWHETLVPTIDQARCALRSCDPVSRAFVRDILVALRDFDRAL